MERSSINLNQQQQQINIMPANTYQLSFREPLVRSMEVGGEVKDSVIVAVIIDMVAKSEDDYQVHQDAAIPLTADPDNFIRYEDLDEAWFKAIAEPFILENNWYAVLDKSIEAKRLQPLHRPLPWQLPVEEPAE